MARTKITLLTDELTLKIRKLVLQGVKYKEIQETLNILDNTWDTWVNKDYKDFRKNLISWKKERLTKKAEKLSEEILDMLHTNNGKVDTELLRIKQKEAEFIRKTLAKDDYSERTEHTGKDGERLIPEKEIQDKADASITIYLNGNKRDNTKGNT